MPLAGEGTTEQLRWRNCNRCVIYYFSCDVILPRKPLGEEPPFPKDGKHVAGLGCEYADPNFVSDSTYLASH